MRAPDAAFADPRLAVLYDDLHEPRIDLDAYVDITEEFGAHTVVDVGCGTGSLALRLAALGRNVFGVDPARASLDVARAKPDAERVTWVTGDATDLVPLRPDADLVVMTGNVAQVFVSDDDWTTTLDAVHALLRPGGWFAFETRRPEVCDWERWNVPPSTITLPGGAEVTFSRIVTEVAPPLVTFEAVTTVDGQPLASVSTLRFRSRRDVETDLVNHGFEIAEVRDAPDRPGQELVFLARRRG
jgi:SAM-dependent methyltransferase